MVAFIVRRNDFGMRRNIKSEHVLIVLRRSIDDMFVEIHKKCREKKIRLSLQYEFNHDNLRAFLKQMYPSGVHVHNKMTARRMIFKDSQPNIIIQDPCTPKFDSPRTRRFHSMAGFGIQGYYHRYISDAVNALALERGNKQCISTLVFSSACYEKREIPVKQIIPDLPENSWYLLVMGSYHPHDHFHTVIDAFIHYMNTCENKPEGIGMCVFLGKYNPQNVLHVRYKSRLEYHANDSLLGDHFIFLDKQRSRRTRSLISQSSCIVYLRQNVRYVNRDVEAFMRGGTQAILVRFGPEVDFIHDHNCGVLIRKPTVLRLAYAIENAMHPRFYREHCTNSRFYYVHNMTKFQLYVNQITNSDENKQSNYVPSRINIRPARSWPTTNLETKTEDLQLRYDNKPFDFEFDLSDDESNDYFRVDETPSDGYSTFQFDSDWYIAPTSLDTTSIEDESEEDLYNGGR